MAHKYHVKRDGSGIALCDAKVRKCSLQPADFRVPGQVSAAPTAEKQLAPTAPPILLEKSPLPAAPSYPRLEEYAGFEVDYSAWSDEDDENRESYYVYYHYDDPEIKSVDIRKLLARIHGDWRGELVPQELVDLAVAEGWDKPEKYTIEALKGFYSDELEILPADEDEFRGFLNKLTERYWAYSGAEDNDGVLADARGRGVDTTGLSPVDAVKAQLQAENPDRVHKLVESAKSVHARQLRIDDVVVPNPKHYDRVEARYLHAPKGVQKVAGVVVQRDGRYVLVDGYHRLKGLKEKNVTQQAKLDKKAAARGRRAREAYTSGYYFVLSDKK